MKRELTLPLFIPDEIANRLHRLVEIARMYDSSLEGKTDAQIFESMSQLEYQQGHRVLDKLDYNDGLTDAVREIMESSAHQFFVNAADYQFLAEQSNNH